MYKDAYGYQIFLEQEHNPPLQDLENLLTREQGARVALEREMARLQNTVTDLRMEKSLPNNRAEFPIVSENGSMIKVHALPAVYVCVYVCVCVCICICMYECVYLCVYVNDAF